MRLAPMPFRERLKQIAAEYGEVACWPWPGFCAAGYGKVTTTLDERGSRVWFAHRAAYTVLVGPVPEELEMDHLCRNRRCINPAHLEPVTPRENVLRSPVAIPAQNARKTHCKNGHELTPGNVYATKSKYGVGRACKACTIKSATESAKKRPRGNQCRPAAGRVVTQCQRGHEMTGDNVIVPADGRRRCRECQRWRSAVHERTRRHRVHA